jgi:3-oxoacyl-[acyl-carrier protein] reductase
MTAANFGEEFSGRRVLITGVSRRRGIGFALARGFLDRGASVVAQSWAEHDARQPWGADPVAPSDLVGTLTSGNSSVGHIAADFAEESTPRAVLGRAEELVGAIDVLVVNHAHSAEGAIGDLSAEALDLAWAVNVRSSLLLVQEFARRCPGPGGRIVLFTSGQHHEPMPDELPYAITKGALQQATASLAAALISRGITVNCVDPGPTDTGWADDGTRRQIEEVHPSGRWGKPADAVALVLWLASESAGWVTGQTIVSDGGWSLRR